MARLNNWRHVRLWHKADMTTVFSNVRFRARKLSPFMEIGRLWRSSDPRRLAERMETTLALIASLALLAASAGLLRFGRGRDGKSRPIFRKNSPLPFSDSP
jgi:hypothetical protein